MRVIYKHFLCVGALCLVAMTYMLASANAQEQGTDQEQSETSSAASQESSPTESSVEKSDAVPAQAPATDQASKTEPTAAKSADEFKLPDGLQWETNNEDPVWADPNAKKGGTYRTSIRSYPTTFRQVGPNSNNSFRRVIDSNDMSLLSIHPNTKKFIPSLATHWAVAADNKTVYFKLDGRAKWSDGKPVTAEDFLFTLEFMRSPHIVAPWFNDYYTKEISKVVKHSDEVISVVSGKEHIKYTLLQITGISPTPRQFSKLDKDFVTRYNWKVKPNTGPYVISSFKKGKFVRLKRKKDWWAKDLKYIKNRYNYDVAHYKVIRHPESQWQAFLKGDLTSHHATIPSIWREKAKGKVFDQGYIHKLQVSIDSPPSQNILWINETKDPFTDVQVRRAFGHALNFDKVIKEVLRGDYTRQDAFNQSYGEYDNKSIKAREFSIEKVTSLMKDAGWSLGDSGLWEKSGAAIKVTITYSYEHHTDRLVVLQEEAKKAGFDIALELLDPNAGYKKAQEKNHQVVWQSYGGGGIPPPVYWQYFHSENAKPQSNNFTMTQDHELDKLIDQYRDTFDEKLKQELSRKILQNIHDRASFIPGFDVPIHRMLYWRGWKLPKVPGTMDGVEISTMWFDPQEDAKLKEYQKSGKSFGPSLTIDTTYARQ